MKELIEKLENSFGDDEELELLNENEDKVVFNLVKMARGKVSSASDELKNLKSSKWAKGNKELYKEIKDAHTKLDKVTKDMRLLLLQIGVSAGM